jgi:hypothetical protein
VLIAIVLEVEMLIHLNPSFFLNYSNISVNLIDVEIPELALHLHAERDIYVRFSSPNKRLHYVCRKKGRKAIYGILPATPERECRGQAVRTGNSYMAARRFGRHYPAADRILHRRQGGA